MAVPAGWRARVLQDESESQSVLPNGAMNCLTGTGVKVHFVRGKAAGSLLRSSSLSKRLQGKAGC